MIVALVLPTRQGLQDPFARLRAATLRGHLGQHLNVLKNFSGNVPGYPHCCGLIVRLAVGSSHSDDLYCY